MKSKTNDTTLHSREVPADRLRWYCNPKTIGSRTTSDIKPLHEIIGQDRAIRALRLGLEIKHYGYNVFVTGFSGTGRTTTLKRLLSEFQQKQTHLHDRCFVHNFRDQDQPILITVEAGRGVQLRDDMDELISDLQKNIPAVLESRRYQEARKQTLDHFQERQKSILKDFEKKVKERGFELIQVQVGQIVRPDIAPVIDSSPVNFDQLDSFVQQGKLTKETADNFVKDRAALESQMEILLKEMRNIERKAKESVDELSQQFLLPLVSNRIEELREKYKDEKIHAYFDEVQANIMENAIRFLPADESQAKIVGVLRQQQDDSFTEFKVNVVVDNSQTTKIPIVIETNPRFKNLFGTIEREVDRAGTWRMDFTMIRGGSLLKADGGYLVLNALDTLVEPGVWQTLKRTLRNQLLEIQPIETGLFGASSALKPEPIPIDVKAVLIGDAYIYTLLYEQDDDFKKIFKVRADFDVEMPKGDNTVGKYVSFVKTLCDDEKLRPFDAEGVAEVVEYGVRLAGRQNKLSTRFDIVANILREANYWAGKDEAPGVTRGHVRRAIEERIDRVKLIEEKIQEMILEGSILIDCTGAEVGQVNGLSVYQLPDHSFGKPSRITVRTAMGKAGVINIEREADLSGPTHDKGVLILSGYLRGKYAGDKPLIMSASIAFEQSYSGIDGDSASATEVYAILSSLAEIPLRQDIAVTGSVNQKGEIQPIGGVNQKIEGFFDVCRARGLTGNQGVIIPNQNVHDLMLRHDVIEAVKEGKFHIYAVGTIDEGIELLTGKKAGKSLGNGDFEKGSVHDLVNRKLKEYAKLWKVIEKAGEA